MFISKFRKYCLNRGNSLVSAGLAPNMAIDGSLYFRAVGVVLLLISSLTWKTGNHTYIFMFAIDTELYLCMWKMGRNGETG